MAGTIEEMFVTYHESDDAETLFRKTVNATAGMLWVLEAPEQTLAVLDDLLGTGSDVVA